MLKDRGRSKTTVGGGGGGSLVGAAGGSRGSLLGRGAGRGPRELPSLCAVRGAAGALV